MNIVMFLGFLVSFSLFIYISGGFVLMYRGKAEYDNMKVQIPVWCVSFICSLVLFANLFLK